MSGRPRSSTIKSGRSAVATAIASRPVDASSTRAASVEEGFVHERADLGLVIDHEDRAVRGGGHGGTLHQCIGSRHPVAARGAP